MPPDLLSFPSLQRRSIRSSGRLLALGMEGSLQRSDSEAVLVEAEQPIHRDEEGDSLDEDGFGPAEYIESNAETDRGEVEEAVNPHVIMRQGPVITINVDTSTSVI